MSTKSVGSVRTLHDGGQLGVADPSLLPDPEPVKQLKGMLGAVKGVVRGTEGCHKVN